MSANEVSDFIRQLQALGVRLTVTPLADGTVRLNKWRDLKYPPNAHLVEELWAGRIGSDPAALNQLTKHVAAGHGG